MELAAPLAPPSSLQSLQKVKAVFVPEESCRPGGWGSVSVAPSWEWVVRVPTASVYQVCAHGFGCSGAGTPSQVASGGDNPPGGAPGDQGFKGQ